MSTTPPVVQQNAGTPPGNIPKGRQTYIMVGIAVVIVLSIVFSGSANKPNVKTGANLPPLNVNTPSKKEIDSYAQTLAQMEQQAKRAQSDWAKTTQGGIASPATAAAANTGLQGGIPGQAIIGPDGRAYYSAGVSAQPVTTNAAPQPNPLMQEKEKMEFTSLYASPVALSLRPQLSSSSALAGSPSAGSNGAAVDPVGSSPVVLSAVSSRITPAAVTPSAVAPVSVTPVSSGPRYGTEKIPEHLLFEGTILEAVLTNRLSGSFSGPVNCMVTTNVYSHDHNLLIIPQGTRVLGEAKRVNEQQQQRLAVSFHRLIMPDGYSVNLDRPDGLDQLGATGLKDKTDNHYLQVFGTSVALGLFAGFAQSGTGSALTAGGLDTYRQGVASQISQNSSTVLSRQLNRLPDITIREGQRVRILLTKDLELPAYAAHTARGDL